MSVGVALHGKILRIYFFHLSVPGFAEQAKLLLLFEGGRSTLKRAIVGVSPFGSFCLLAFVPPWFAFWVCVALGFLSCDFSGDLNHSDVRPLAGWSTRESRDSAQVWRVHRLTHHGKCGIDTARSPSARATSTRLDEARAFPSIRLDEGLTGVFNRGGTCTGEP